MFQMSQKRYNFTISSIVSTSRTKVECAIVNAGRQHTYNTSVFLISSYGASLAQRASYLALHSSHFGPVAQLIMIILSPTALTLS